MDPTRQPTTAADSEGLDRQRLPRRPVGRRQSRPEPSATAAVKSEVRALQARGIQVFDLSLGEPQIPAPDHIIEGTIAALRAGHTRYPPAGGIAELREAIVEKYRREANLSLDAGRVLVTNGAKEALSLAFNVVLDPGAEVLIPGPCWVSYPHMVSLAGGTPKVLPCSPAAGYKLTPRDLRATLTPDIRALVLTNPSNPTGSGYSPAELRDLGRVLADSSALIISDEVYEKITYPGFAFQTLTAAAPELAERTLTVNSCSKSYAMSGWGIGYAFGPQELIDAMAARQSQTTGAPAAFSQHGAVAALQGGAEHLPEMVADYWRRINLVERTVQLIPGLSLPALPAGGPCVFIRLDELMAAGGVSGSDEFARRLIEEEAVAVVPGSAFCDDGAFRISVCCASEAELWGGLARIAALCDRLLERD